MHGRTLNFFSKGACCSLCFLHSYSKIIRLIASFPIVSSIVLTLFTQLNSDSHPAVVFICACNIYYFDPTFVLPQNHYRCGGGIMACLYTHIYLLILLLIYTHTHTTRFPTVPKVKQYVHILFAITLLDFFDIFALTLTLYFLMG